MKFLSVGKDGGPDSTVTGYWLIEIKWLFSIVLLKFEGESRPVYHSHAFNAISWVLSGTLFEHVLYGGLFEHLPGPAPIFTYKDTLHKVNSTNPTWVLSLRGPWSKIWYEYDPFQRIVKTLQHGRKEVE